MGGSLTYDELIEYIEMDEYKNIKNFVETGTYKGDTTVMVSKHFENVYTTEIVNDLHIQSKERAIHAGIENITFLLGDSVELLKEITPRVVLGAVFFLDARQSGGDTSNNGKNHVPLFQELDVILSHNVGPSIYIMRLFDKYWDWTGITPSSIVAKFQEHCQNVVKSFPMNDRYYVLTSTKIEPVQKKICCFSQTHGDARDVVFRFKAYDKLDNYFRNKLSGNVYGFHGVSEEKRKEINESPFFKDTSFDNLLYSKDEPYPLTLRKSLQQVKDQGYTHFIFLQDDVFTFENVQDEKQWDDLYRLIQDTDFNLINLETQASLLKCTEDDLLATQGDIKLYKSDTIANKKHTNWYFGDYPYIAKIDYLLDVVYTPEYFSLNYIWDAEYYVNQYAKTNPLEMYVLNTPFYRRLGLCGRSGVEHFRKHILEMEVRFEDN
jgi:hypothetical protein